MLSDDTWREIGRRKQPYSRTTAIGELVGWTTAPYREALSGQLGVAREAMDSVVDGSFWEQCQLVGLRNGRLTIGVRDPARLDVLRRRHLFALRECLATTAVRVTDIRWVVHRD